MIGLAPGLWIGDSADEEHADLDWYRVTGVLLVAHDLDSTRGWEYGLEVMHVGLIDGPGNEPVVYSAAVLALVALMSRHKQVVVIDHHGSRALVVAMMWLNLTGGKYRPDPLSWSHWMTWDEKIAEVGPSLLDHIPAPHAAHIQVFNKLPYGLLEAFL